MSKKITPTLAQIKSQLLKGANAWNRWRTQYKNTELSLAGLEISNQVLDGVDFSELSLTDASIVRCSMREATCINTNFSRSNLCQNDFSGAKLIAANFSHADLSDCIIVGASILMANVEGAKLEHIDFRGHDLSALNLRGASLARSNLEKQVLAKLDLTGVNLEDANLSHCDLSYTNFSRSNLRSVNLRGATIDSTIFKSCDLSNVNFKSMDLSDINFHGADLSGCDLREADLGRSNLERANLTGVKLWKINIRRWNISDVRCDHAFWGSKYDVKTTYKRHEFERLYSQSGTVDVKYPYHLSTQEITTIPILIEHLQGTFWGAVFRLKSIKEVAGGTLVSLKIEEYGDNSPVTLKQNVQIESERIVNAHVALRGSSKLLIQLREEIAQVKERFWPRLLELAAEYEREQSRLLTIVFMDLKGFSLWGNDELSEKLGLFRGLIKPILNKWGAAYPNMEGDSLRITFSNACAALGCACMIKGVLTGAGFELRIGVELGSVSVVHNEVTGNSDLEGTAVSMAARLEASAKTGQVLVTNNVKQYSEQRNLFKFKPVKISLSKSIGEFKKGDVLECFDVSPLGSLTDV